MKIKTVSPAHLMRSMLRAGKSLGNRTMNHGHTPVKPDNMQGQQCNSDHSGSSLLSGRDGRDLRRKLARWNWEILWTTVSVASLAATIVLLAYQNNRRLDAWTTFFSLNTFVSILAQVSRTSLAFGLSSSLGQAKWNFFRRRPGSLAVFDVFDQASRGPWGSANLTWRLRWR